MKICRDCKIPKDLSCFYKKGASRGGVRSDCKECYSKKYKFKKNVNTLAVWHKYKKSEKGICRNIYNNARERANIIFWQEKWMMDNPNHLPAELKQATQEAINKGEIPTNRTKK